MKFHKLIRFVCFIFISAALLSWKTYAAEQAEIKTEIMAGKEMRSYEVKLFQESSTVLFDDSMKNTTVLIFNLSKENLQMKNGKSEILQAWQEGARNYIKIMGELSPASKIGIIFFTDKVNSLEPMFLTEENRKKLLNFLEKADEFVKKNEKPALAYEKFNEFFLNEKVDMGYERKVIFFSNTDKKKDAKKALGKAKVFFLDGNKTDDKKFLYEVFCSLFDIEPYEVILEPDFRFFLRNREEIEKNGGSRISEEGTTKITFKMLPFELPGFEWEQKVSVVAKDDFLGGNDVSVFKETSGIYKEESCIFKIDSPKVNIPLNIEFNDDVEQQIFLGQKIPADINELGLMTFICKKRDEYWCSKEATGKFAVVWREKNGEIIGSNEAFGEIKPTESQDYLAEIEFIPISNGENAFGKPVRETKFEVPCRFNVVKGRINIKLDLIGDEIVIFSLKGNQSVLYKAITDSDFSEDGEHSLREISFENLPYGEYMLTQESVFGEENEPILCRIGLEENSDKIDTKNSEITVYPKLQQNGERGNTRCISMQSIKLAAEQGG